NMATETLSFGINGSLRKREVQAQPQTSYTEYYLFNSAANLKAYSNNGLDFAYYGYNASNTRAYKLSMLNQNQWVNGQPEPLHLQLQSAMFYPNAYINFNQNGEYTKHYYNGAERIASRLGTVTLNIATTANARLNTRSVQLEDCFRNDIRTLVYAGDIPMDMPPEPVSATLQTTGTSSDIFYYHTNHLGSTAFVTDNNTNIHQGFLYAPFGEITTEYDINFGYNVLPKYSFNAKELDEETGMYYYEARYYKPPVFTSRDPMFEKYFWMTPYAYCTNNPVKYVDPTGMKIWIVGEDGNEIEYIPGMQYEGESDFQKQVIEALNYGYANSATAEKMIGELCGPEFQYKISSGNESGYSPSLDCAVIYKEGADEAFYEKGGGVITWNPQGESVFEKDPKSGLSVLYCRPTMGLLHELGHAWDHMAGLLMADEIKFKGLEVNEWTATRTENMIRKELNLPLRTYYRANKWEGKSNVSGPALLDLNGNHRYTKYQHQ
ncbi:MAG: hypothetical protein J6S82_10865, partial [Bacteroidales bacterium]|nr:hypothetical protein [Bacteroidales bacterium]